jgi:exportin-1
MEEALQRLLDFTQEFDVALLDNLVTAAYDPVNPQRAEANKVLMALKDNPDLWTKADGILERASNPHTRFLGVSILDDAIRYRCVIFIRQLNDCFCCFLVQYMENILL